MYFWRIAALKTELRRGPLPQGQAFAYVLATMLLLTALTSVPALWNAPPEGSATPSPAAATAVEWVGYVVGLAIVALGTRAAYRANGGAAGADFVARYVALGWVLGLRLLLLAFLPGIALILAAAGGLVLTGEGRLATDVAIAALGTLLSVGLEALYYWRLVHHFRGVAAPEAAAAAGPERPALAGPAG